MIVLPRTGFWTSIPVWLARERVPQALLFEGASYELVQLYTSLGLRGIKAEPGVEIKLADGRLVKIPGFSPLRPLLKALNDGMAVGFLGDVCHPRGVPTRLLGVDVRVINHYARVATNRKTPIVYLRHWTSPEAINLEFIEIEGGRWATRKQNIESIVKTCMQFLQEDLLARPEQYAYGPDSVFAFSHRS